MLTGLRIRNFKCFDEATIELGDLVVLVGPNNSGKTTALQALMLWDAGLRTWLGKRLHAGGAPEKRPGVSINRKDLISLPVPDALLLWNDLHARSTTHDGGERVTENVRVEITVDGRTSGEQWTCGLEFDYANEESLYCRPSRAADGARMPVPDAATRARIAYLPPMSGLVDREFVKQQGEIDYLVGQGQTAHVLRNMCYNLLHGEAGEEKWDAVVRSLLDLYGVELLRPELVDARSEISMSYRERGTSELDLSSAGRGLQQTLLLLTFLWGNQGSIILLDEPDAHLEILRQRQIFALLTRTAAAQGSQIIAASHSEVILNEAASRGKVVAFVGKPHVITGRGGQVRKALAQIGFDQYYQAERTGWVLYLPGAAHIDVLRAFARSLEHRAVAFLEDPFLRVLGTNLPELAREHFSGLREAKPDLAGVALLHCAERDLEPGGPLAEMAWRRGEIEGYLCMPEALEAYAVSGIADDLFGHAERSERLQAMRAAIEEVAGAPRAAGKPDPWSPEGESADAYLDALLGAYARRTGAPLAFGRADYYRLAAFVPRGLIPPEIVEKLDAIADVAERARPG